MCFSVNVNLVKEELESRYGATLIDQDKYRPSYYYHAFAIPEMPVLCSGDAAHLQIFKWGLIPAHTRSMDEAESIRSKTFNARAEGLSDKSSFSSSFKSKRCIVPVKGFFEWQHAGKQKTPWYIFHSEDGILSLAGLYDQWTFDRTGEVFNTFTIITTEANEMIAEIHNSTRRMPAVLEPHEEKLWIDISASEEDVRSLLKPARPDILKAHTVSPLVSSRTAEKNIPEVIRPYQYHIQNKLF